MTEVVTQLIVDATGAQRGSKEFVDAMTRAEAAQVKAVDSMTKGPGSMRRVVSEFESLQSKADPIWSAQITKQKEVEKAMLAASKAVALGVPGHERAAEAVAKVTAKHDALIAAAQKGAQAQTSLGKAMTGVSGQMVALSAGAGPVGTLLAGMGPWGLAAAAGVGAVSAAMSYAKDEAHNFADEMLRIRDAASSVGLATSQLQALGDEGAKFALSEEKINMAIGRFSASMEEFRRGQGDLYGLVQRIDPALAKEMAQTRSTAEAVDKLAQVYEKAGNARQKLDRAVGGRNGAGIGLWVQEIAKDGGVDKLTEDFKKSGDAIDDEMIKKVARLKAEIDDMSGDARRNIASIFSVQVLESEYKFTEQWREFSRLAKEFSLSGDWNKFVDKLSDQGFLDKLTLITSAMPVIGNIVGIVNAGAKVKAGMNKLDSHGADPFAQSWEIPADKPSSATATKPTTPATDRANLEFELNTLRATNSAMGEAATATSKLREKKLSLDLQLRDNIITQEQYNRALGVAHLNSNSAAVSARISILGQDAAASDIALAKQQAIDKANLAGAGITEKQTAALKAKAVAMHEASQPQFQNQFERDQLSRDPTEQAIAAKMMAEHGSAYKDHMDGAAAAFMRQTAQMRELKDMMAEAGSSFLSSLMQGQSVTKSLGGALAQQGNKAAQAGMSRLMTNPSTFFGTQSVASANGAMGMAGAGMAGYQSASPLAGAIGGAMAGAAFGPIGMGIGAVVGGIGGLIGSNNKKKEEEKARREAEERAAYEAAVAANDRRYDYQNRAKMAVLDTSKEEDTLKAFDINADAQRRQESKAGNQAIVDLEKALSAERLRVVEDFAKRAAEAEKQRRTEYSDRLFNATNDTSTIGGALSAFDREAQYQREAELKAGNGAIADLELALSAERLNIIDAFNKQALEEEKRRADLMIGYAKNINDYLNSLKLGDLSNLSPEEKMAASRTSYESQLSLAQGGDQTATQNITTVAQAYLEQLRSFYGPSKIYGDLFAQVTSQLGALAQDITGMQYGGIVGSYAGGGVVGNGVYNVDSVRARFAGGGDIELAGGEHVTRASSVNSRTFPILDSINRTGSAPNSSNDNSELVAELRASRSEVRRLLSAVASLIAEGNARTSDVSQGISGLRTDTKINSEEKRLRNAA